MTRIPDQSADYGFIHFAYLDDETVMGLYDRMASEGLLEMFFYADQLQTREAFLDYVRGKAWGFVAMLGDEVAAFAFLDCFTGRAAYFHHCHFRWAWRYTTRTARAALAWLAEVRPVETLIGITPETNRLAVNYAQKCGFTILGTIPRALFVHGEPVGAVVSYYELKESEQ